MNSRFAAMLGFAAKAGALVSGETGCLQALAKGKAKLLILADDASKNTQDRFTTRSRSVGCQLVTQGKAQELGRAIGKPRRACVAILEDRFSKALLDALGEVDGM